MTTPPPGNAGPSDQDGAEWGAHAQVSVEKQAAEQPFDPYRYGAPEHPVPPEYAPPGYIPPAPANQVPPPLPPGFSGYYGQHPSGPMPYPYAPPNYSQYPQPRAGNGKAIGALVLGILSIVFCWASLFDLVLIIPALALGSMGLNDAKRPGAGGRGMAIAGLTCAAAGAVIAIVLTVWLAPKVAHCMNDYQRGSTAYNDCLRTIVQ